MTVQVLIDPDRHPVIGHRGASGSAPENTMVSFNRAADEGADAFELDVRLAADGVPVVCHDPTLERTCGRVERVDALPAAVLATVDAGARFTTDGVSFPFRGRGIGIPSLREVLEQHPALAVLIELKVAQAAGPVSQVLRDTGAADRCVIASFLPEAIDAVLDSGILAGASRREIMALTVQAWLGRPRPAGVSLYAVPVRYKDLIPVPTRRFVAAARRLGCPVHVWTVNEVPLAQRLWDRGCAGIITNFPAAIRAARDRRFGPPQA